jgi:formylglycine-generating enzyme required for sulfatase activity
MKPKPLFLTILLLVTIIVSGCGSPAVETPTNAPVLVIPTSTATEIPAVPSNTPTAEPVPVIPTSTPTEIPALPSPIPPTSIPTVKPTLSVAPALAPGSLQVSSKDGMEMVFVPAGDFIMGSLYGIANEQPVHTVTLGAFWIDKTEVTNLMYGKCVQSGQCLKPQNQSNTHFNYYSDQEFANYPVVNLKWSSADKYCAWAGRRLPTEAEWEKAARGTDGRTYPWGNSIPSDTLLNFNAPAGDTVRVGSYPKGASPYGALDMAGNLREWVADWYEAGYYVDSPKSNPTGPANGLYKVLRGGSWFSDASAIRSSNRQKLPPDVRDVSVGFRCVITGP